MGMIMKWLRGEKQQRLEDECHPDLIEAALATLRLREAKAPRGEALDLTMIVWVKAHFGDPCNEAADFEAKAGAECKEVEWDIDTTPIPLFSNLTDSFEPLHEAKWTATVERHARQHLGRGQNEYLYYNNEAKSTHYTLRGSKWRENFGVAYNDPTLQEQAVRDIMQARLFCFPTASVISRNKGGTKDPKCVLCKKAKDTIGHRMGDCTWTAQAQSKMHNDIADKLINAIATALRGKRTGHDIQTVEVFPSGPRIDSIWPDCPLELAAFEPDGIIIVRAPPGCKALARIILIEFA